MVLRAAVLLLLPGERYDQWYATVTALQAVLGVQVVTIARSYNELMRIVWNPDEPAEVGVVPTRADVEAEPLIVIEEVRAPAPPAGPLRPRWLPQQ